MLGLSHAPVDAGRFTAAMAELPSGVTVATCRDHDGRPLGATMSSVTSLSLDPPMVLACFERRSTTLRRLRRPGASFLLHVLAAGQETVAQTFASRVPDKFDGLAWADGRLGLPEIEGCAAVIACRVQGLLPGGDHVIVTGLVVDTGIAGRRPLVYHRRRMTAVPGLS